jgi:hypothetical protein
MSTKRKWDISTRVNLACIVAGTFLVFIGVGWHLRTVTAWGAGLLVLGLVHAAAVVVFWLRYKAGHGGHFCFIWQFGVRRVHHLHWPRADIVNCGRSAGFHVGRRS